MQLQHFAQGDLNVTILVGEQERAVIIRLSGGVMVYNPGRFVGAEGRSLLAGVHSITEVFANAGHGQEWQLTISGKGFPRIIFGPGTRRWDYAVADMHRITVHRFQQNPRAGRRLRVYGNFHGFGSSPEPGYLQIAVDAKPFIEPWLVVPLGFNPDDPTTDLSPVPEFEQRYDRDGILADEPWVYT